MNFRSRDVSQIRRNQVAAQESLTRSFEQLLPKIQNPFPKHRVWVGYRFNGAEVAIYATRLLSSHTLISAYFDHGNSWDVTTRFRVRNDSGITSAQVRTMAEMAGVENAEVIFADNIG